MRRSMGVVSTTDNAKLTGAERKALRKAVLAAFDYEGLKQALAEAPNSRDLGDLVSPEASFDDRTAQLITRSIKEGWVQKAPHSELCS